MQTKHECNPHCKTLASLWLIKAEAERKATRYKSDPFLRDLHSQYAEAISSVIEADLEISRRMENV
jgi:hypothetical protein